MYQDLLDPKRTNTWGNLSNLSQHTQKDWVRKNFREIIQTLEHLPADELMPWNLLGYVCIDNNLYQEAEKIYDELFKKTQKEHGNIGLPAYYRGIAHFLQGRFQDAYNDFKISRQSDIHLKKMNLRQGPVGKYQLKLKIVFTAEYVILNVQQMQYW